jgi:hypothetical protein
MRASVVLVKFRTGHLPTTMSCVEVFGITHVTIRFAIYESWF